ncbi:MAG: hypothetical protein C4547_07575 [Phycisphaerales bacterium]|nr:MAG: hypothetical protein C4547_07575 [Phycisphaerales bacterium]
MDYFPLCTFCVIGAEFVSGLALGLIAVPEKFPVDACRKCGYLLRGLPEPRCPECGTAFDSRSLGLAPQIDDRRL